GEAPRAARAAPPLGGRRPTRVAVRASVPSHGRGGCSRAGAPPPTAHTDRVARPAVDRRRVGCRARAGRESVWDLRGHGTDGRPQGGPRLPRERPGVWSEL